jgi:cyanophycinase
MKRLNAPLGLLLALALAIAPALSAQDHGPARGTLIVSGGAGDRPTPHIYERFIELAGGPDAPIVVIPTSGQGDLFDESCTCLELLRRAGARNLQLLHTRDRSVADTDAFVEPIKQASAVWLAEGSSHLHADAYLDTKVHRELFALLDRGGVVGGGSAGARIQSDYMPLRGAERDRVLPPQDHRRGFRLLRNVIIDVHVLTRNRQFDLIGMVQAHPEMLGIAMDENTAIEVHGDDFEVIGTSYVLIYDNQRQILPEAGSDPTATVGGSFYFLRPGDQYDMKTRQAFRPEVTRRPLPRVVEKSWKAP